MRLTAVLNIKHVVWGGYTAIETILALLPIVDKFLINDGGSEGKDDTSGYLKRLQEMYPDKIELFDMPWGGIDCHKAFEDSLIYLMNQVPNDEWLICSHADEMWHEKDIFRLKEKIQWCNDNGYNSIRGQYFPIGNWVRIDPLIYEHVRCCRKVPKLTSDHWGDCFHIEGKLSTHPLYNGSNHPPEFYMDIKFYHMHRVFVQNYKDQSWAMGYFAGAIDPPRRPYWESIKDEDWSLVNWVPKKEDVLDCIPAIVKDMYQYPKYFVREDLFDKDWLTKTSGIDYHF